MPDAGDITYSVALNEALRTEMRRDPSVICLGEDIARWGSGGGVFGVTKDLVTEFGVDRVRDTPISEEGIVAIGVGAAMTGLRPIVEIMYSDFLTLAMDPIVNQAAKMRYMFGGQASVPLVVRTNLGASGGKAAQHSQSCESWFVNVPGVKIVMPGTPIDAGRLLQTAVRDDNPVLFFEHKLLYFAKQQWDGSSFEPLEFGKAAVRRAGADVTIVAFQTMCNLALQAAQTLSEEGIEVEVIDPRTLAPLDLDTIVTSVIKTNRLLVVHEAVETGGWGAELSMQVMEVAFDSLDAPVTRLGSRTVPMPFSESLEKLVIPQVDDITQAVRNLMHGARG